VAAPAQVLFTQAQIDEAFINELDNAINEVKKKGFPVPVPPPNTPAPTPPPTPPPSPPPPPRPAAILRQAGVEAMVIGFNPVVARHY
jgi:hypothetical protein